MVLLHEVIINGVDVTSYIKSWSTKDELFAGITDAEVELTQDVAGILTATIGQTITIKRGFTTATDEFVFNGEISEIEKTGGVTFSIFCKDKLIDLIKESVTKSYDENIDTEAGVVSDIFTDLINTYGGGTLIASAVSVQDSSALPNLTKFVCDGDDVYERCQFLADLIDWQFYYKASTGLVYFEPKGFLGSYGTLTTGTEINETLNWSYDATQLANNITVKGAKQEVETTESGQIGVTTGFTTSQAPTLFTPVSVKVFIDNANPPTTLKVGGIINSSTAFDYIVDKQNKLIEWSTTFTPGASDFVEIRYSYNIPAPVVGKNVVSISTYGEFKKTFKVDDLKTVEDAENKMSTLLVKYSTPFIGCDEVVLHSLIDVVSGETIVIIDNENVENRAVLIQSVEKSFPYKGDKISVGDKLWRTSEWQVDVIDKLRELEKQLEGDIGVLTHVISLDRSAHFRRKTLDIYKRTLKATGWVWGDPRTYTQIAADGGVWGDDSTQFNAQTLEYSKTY